MNMAEVFRTAHHLNNAIRRASWKKGEYLYVKALVGQQHGSLCVNNLDMGEVNYPLTPSDLLADDWLSERHFNYNGQPKTYGENREDEELARQQTQDYRACTYTDVMTVPHKEIKKLPANYFAVSSEGLAKIEYHPGGKISSITFYDVPDVDTKSAGA